MYAIVRTGGKQYRVEEGRSLDVDRLPVEEGTTVELGSVLLIAEDGSVTIGTPTIEGARVLAHVDTHGRTKKIIVFNYKNKVRTRKKNGHRQNFTRLTVEEILLPGQEAKAKPKRARKAKAAEEPEAIAAPAAEAPEAEIEAIAEPVAEAPVVEEAPKPRTRRAAPKAAKKALRQAQDKALRQAQDKAPPAKAEKPKKALRQAQDKAPRGKAEAKKDEKKPARRRILRRKKED